MRIGKLNYLLVECLVKLRWASDRGTYIENTGEWLLGSLFCLKNSINIEYESVKVGRRAKKIRYSGDLEAR